MEAIKARLAGRLHFRSERSPRPMQPDVQGIGENTETMSSLLLRLALEIHLYEEFRLSRLEPCDVFTKGHRQVAELGASKLADRGSGRATIKPL